MYKNCWKAAWMTGPVDSQMDQSLVCLFFGDVPVESICDMDNHQTDPCVGWGPSDEFSSSTSLSKHRRTSRGLLIGLLTEKGQSIFDGNTERDVCACACVCEHFSDQCCCSDKERRIARRTQGTLSLSTCLHAVTVQGVLPWKQIISHQKC